MSPRTLLILRYAFAGVAVALLLVIIDVAELAATVSKASPGLLVLGIGIGYACWLLNTWKWQYLIAAQARSPSFLTLFRLNLVSALYGTVLPGQVAGEAVKVVRLSRSAADRRILMASVLVDRVTGLIGLLLVGLAAALVSGAPRVAVLTLAAGLVGGLVVSVWAIRLRRGDIPSGGRSIGRVWNAAARLVIAAARFGSHPRSLAFALVLSIGFQLLLSINVWIFAQALSIDIGIASLAWIVAFVSLVQLLPITVAGLGTREGAFIALLATYSISGADALALGLALFCGNLALALGGGISEWLPQGRCAINSTSLCRPNTENVGGR